MGSGVMRDAYLVEDSSELRAEAWDAFFIQLNENEGLRAHYLNLVRELGEFSVENMLSQSLFQATEYQLFKGVCQRAGVTMLEVKGLDHPGSSDPRAASEQSSQLQRREL